MKRTTYRQPRTIDELKAEILDLLTSRSVRGRDELVDLIGGKAGRVRAALDALIADGMVSNPRGAWIARVGSDPVRPLARPVIAYGKDGVVNPIEKLRDELRARGVDVETMDLDPAEPELDPVVPLEEEPMPIAADDDSDDSDDEVDLDGPYTGTLFGQPFPGTVRDVLRVMHASALAEYRAYHRAGIPVAPDSVTVGPTIDRYQAADGDAGLAAWIAPWLIGGEA